MFQMFMQKHLFLKTKFMLPQIEEQHQIGMYFRNIDNLITLNERKLNKLKQIKKALLNKMFAKKINFFNLGIDKRKIVC